MERTVYPPTGRTVPPNRMVPILVLVVFAVLLLWPFDRTSRDAFGASSVKAEKIRVACIGDSITYGEGIVDREKNSYPAQLGALLGDSWEVRNFGVNSVTVLKNGGNPYHLTQTYTDAIAFLPHVVIIHLGTNDALPEDWKMKDNFIRDYKSLIKSFRKLETRPLIILCTPVPAYRNGSDADVVIQNEVIPQVREIAEKMGLAVVDLNGAMLGRKELFNGVHPNEKGARLMAELIASALTENIPKP